MPWLFRAMKEDANGGPQLGGSARTLGIRLRKDVPATLPRDLVQPGQGGMSVSPDDPANLPQYRRPVVFGGVSKDPLWMIDQADLGGDLKYVADSANAGHGFIEPARPMNVDDYQRALERTQRLWTKVIAGPINWSASHAP